MTCAPPGAASRRAPSNVRAAVLLACLAGLVVVLPAVSPRVATAQGSEAEGPRLTPEQEQIAQGIFNDLISPCCWTTTVAQHGSGQAPVIQAEVREMLAAGRTREAILDHYVAKFGERILAKPRKTGFNLAAYWVPYLALALGGFGILILVRRGMKGRMRPALVKAGLAGSTGAGGGPLGLAGGAGGAAGAARSASDEDYRRRLEEELRRTS